MEMSTALKSMSCMTHSTNVLVPIAPCAVGKCTADLDCYNNTAKVSWSPASGASSYTVTAVSADGYLAFCDSVDPQCNLTELECGQVYNVTLLTVSDYCQTETNSTVSFRTRESSHVLFQRSWNHQS